MARRSLILVMSSGFAIVGATIPVSQAQTGHALVLAERACFDPNVTPSTAAYDTCVVRVARAYDRGDPGGAQLEAQRTLDAHVTCRSNGLSPETTGYRQCIKNYVEGRVTMVQTYQTPSAYPAFYDDYVLGPQIAAP